VRETSKQTGNDRLRYDPADLTTIQKLAGYGGPFGPPTTVRYDRRGERAMREAASHLHVPHYFGD
jgi:hypothetical protein